MHDDFFINTHVAGETCNLIQVNPHSYQSVLSTFVILRNEMLRALHKRLSLRLARSPTQHSNPVEARDVSGMLSNVASRHSELHTKLRCSGTFCYSTTPPSIYSLGFQVGVVRECFWDLGGKMCTKSTIDGYHVKTKMEIGWISIVTTQRTSNLRNQRNQ